MARRHRRRDRLGFGGHGWADLPGDSEGTVYAFGAIGPGTSSPLPASPSPSTSQVPEAFELVDTFDAETSGLQVPLYMDVGPDGRLYVANADNHETPEGTDEILVLDRDGQVVRRWGEHGTGPGQFDFGRNAGTDPIGGVAVDSDGFVYVADTVNDRVQKFTSRGRFLLQWGSYGQGDGQFLEPIDVEVGPDGSVYVVDDVRDDIQKFDSDGNFLRKFGEHGSDPGQLKFTGSIAVDPAGIVYVADFDNDRVQAFDTEGGVLWTLGDRGSDPGEFKSPIDVAVDEANMLYVIDPARVQVFDKERNPVAAWNAPEGDGDPLTIAVDGKGFVYVADVFGAHIYKVRILPPPAGA